MMNDYWDSIEGEYRDPEEIIRERVKDTDLDVSGVAVDYRPRVDVQFHDVGYDIGLMHEIERLEKEMNEQYPLYEWSLWY